MAKFDAERLQLVPLTSATRSTKGGTELIVDKGDRSLIKKDRLFLYFDTDNTSFTYTSAGDEDIVRPLQRRPAPGPPLHHRVS